MVHIH